jgi:hypothetical protein
MRFASRVRSTQGEVSTGPPFYQAEASPATWRGGLIRPGYSFNASKLGRPTLPGRLWHPCSKGLPRHLPRSGGDLLDGIQDARHLAHEVRDSHQAASQQRMERTYAMARLSLSSRRPAYRQRRTSFWLPSVPSSRAAIASETESGAPPPPSPCQTELAPFPTAPSRPTSNHYERLVPSFTLAWREGLFQFRTCWRASILSTGAA